MRFGAQRLRLRVPGSGLECTASNLDHSGCYITCAFKLTLTCAAQAPTYAKSRLDFHGKAMPQPPQQTRTWEDMIRW